MTVQEEGKRILVADDDAEIRQLLVTVLRQSGLEVDTAADGNAALALVRERQYAVLVLDLFMPAADGFAVLASLRDAPPARTPVVLVLTAAHDAVVERLDASIIHGVVRKPFDPIELANIVKACADIRSRSTFETMAVAALVAGTPLMALLSGKM